MNSAEREAQIAVRAYQIWERNGRPEGSRKSDWLEAAKAIDAEMGEEVSPAHPTLSDGANTPEPTMPDPFKARRRDAANTDAQSPLPVSAGKSKPQESV